MLKKPKTAAQRQATYAASGRQIACVIRDSAALQALAKLESRHGGVTAAIIAALCAATSRSKQVH